MSLSKSRKPKVSKRLWQPGFVLFWNDRLVEVLCPHCGEIETHYQCNTAQPNNSKDSSSDLAASRIFNCKSQKILPYEIWFPHEGHVSNMGLGWERDVDFERFNTIGLNLPNPTNDSLLDLTKKSRALSIEFEELQDAYENSQLSLMARNGDLAGMKELISNGANIDTTNFCGWTPLMHAAFCGQTACVVLLLEHGACQNNLDTKGRKAFDLAGDCKSLSRERRHGIQRDAEADVEKMQRERLSIRKLLGPTYIPTISSSQQHDAFQTIRNAGKPTGCLTLSARVPVADFQIPSRNATLGVLSRGHPYPDLFAISGWNKASRGSPMLLDNAFYTNEVFELCKSIGYQLPTKNLDNGIPGQFFACHVEKQLATAFLIKHRFVRSKSVWNMHPPQNLRKAAILTNRRPCKDCKSFCTRVGKIFQVEFDFGSIERVKYTEKSTGPIGEKYGESAGEDSEEAVGESSGKCVEKNSRKWASQPVIPTPPETPNLQLSGARRVTRSYAAGLLLTPQLSGNPSWGDLPAVSRKRTKTATQQPEEDNLDNTEHPESPLLKRRATGLLTSRGSGTDRRKTIVQEPEDDLDTEGRPEVHSSRKGCATGLLTPKGFGTNGQISDYRLTFSRKRRIGEALESEDEIDDPESPLFRRNVTTRMRRTVVEVIDLTECSD